MGRPALLRAVRYRVRPNEASANYVEITAPTVAANRAVTLPDAAGVIHVAGQNISVGNHSQSGTQVNTPGTTQNLTATSTITVSGGVVIPIAATANITLTSNPQIAAGTNGQELLLINTSTFTITFAAGNGLTLGRSVRLSQWQSLHLYYSSTAGWIERGYNSRKERLPIVSASATVAQTAFANGAWKQLVWNNEILDQSNVYNPATGDITVPSGTGQRFVTIHAGAALFTNASIVNLAIYVNGVQNMYFLDQRSAASNFLYAVGDVSYLANSGDVLSIWLLQVSGAAMDLTVNAAASRLFVQIGEEI